MLKAYAWPGNIRELRNVLERAVVFSGGHAVLGDVPDVLEPANFPENLRALAPTHSAKLQSIEDMERELIAATLEAMHYKISQAAASLGISRKTLLEKRKKYGLK